MSNPDVRRSYYENENVEYEYYILNGKLHREDGPAYISYNENGNIKYECYYLNGKIHREDGPAFICCHENGDIHYKYYYLNGERLSTDEWYCKLTAKQKVNLLYGKDNE